MRRRSFLGDVVGAMATDQTDQEEQFKKTFLPLSAVSEFANRELPNVARTNTGLAPHAGPWGFDQVAHLLRRTMFGATRGDISAMLTKSLAEIVDQLLLDIPETSQPLNTNSNDTGAPVGQTWVDAATNANNPSRHTSLKSWWTSLMLAQPVSLREKMTLFWHNHFVSEATVIGDARLTYRQNALFREHALGNFKTLAKLVTLDCAMLKYLNGNTNTKTNPNENYARELQELFTIGKGPEIAPGNYTNYTEQDVQQAAKVLTGWRIDTTTFSSYFTATRHDQTNKQFSSAYQNRIIVGQTGTAGANEIDDLLDMIFDQDETARFLCRKLYRYFVYYLIDPAVETNVIEPMAAILRSNNYDVKPALSALLQSEHFYDPLNIGCMIKNPMEMAAGTSRVFSVQFPDSSNIVRQYNHWKFVREQAAAMQMDLYEPPNVAGWPAYYQTPQFSELWINSDTLQKRGQFANTLIATGHTQNGFKLIIDPIAFADAVANPSDPNALIDEFARYLFPIALTANQKAFLKETLIPGLPDYEWTLEWNLYKSNPSDQEMMNAVKSKLQSLLGFMMSMAEYQLT